MNVAMALGLLRTYLEENRADPEIFQALDLVRDEYTRLIGLCMRICDAAREENDSNV